VRVCQLKTQIPLLRSVVHPLLHPGTEKINFMPIDSEHSDRALLLCSLKAVVSDLRRAGGEKPCLLRCQASTTASSIAKQKPCPTCTLQMYEVITDWKEALENGSDIYDVCCNKL